MYLGKYDYKKKVNKLRGKAKGNTTDVKAQEEETSETRKLLRWGAWRNSLCRFNFALAVRFKTDPPSLVSFPSQYAPVVVLLGFSAAKIVDYYYSSFKKLGH